MTRLMKIWLYALVGAPASLVGATDAPTPDLDPDQPINWVDTSHAYATDNAQALAEWMDEFFGDPLYDAERAESYLRLEFVNDWDQEDGNDFKIRLRGQVQLPRISNRLNLVFSGEDSQDLDEEERKQEDQIGLQYKLNEGSRSRVDLTMSFSSSHLKPGIRYRNEGSFSDLYSYRFTQRVQYEDGDGFFSTTLADLNRAVGDNATWRWNNRFIWGERTEGVEWRSKFALRQRMYEDTTRPIAVSYFGVINGVTREENFTKNYKLGIRFRRQMYRDFLFVELEPAYNLRRREYELEREGQWSLVLRLEIALERDLRRVKSNNE